MFAQLSRIGIASIRAAFARWNRPAGGEAHWPVRVEKQASTPSESAPASGAALICSAAFQPSCDRALHVSHRDGTCFPSKVRLSTADNRLCFEPVRLPRSVRSTRSRLSAVPLRMPRTEPASRDSPRTRALCAIGHGPGGCRWIDRMKRLMARRRGGTMTARSLVSRPCAQGCGVRGDRRHARISAGIAIKRPRSTPTRRRPSRR